LDHTAHDSPDDCRFCFPGKSTDAEGSSSSDQCVCSAGLFDPLHWLSDPEATEAEIGACEVCPDGTECEESGVTLATLPLEEGHWRTDNMSTVVLECRHGDACNVETVNGTAACAEGHSGPLCEVCVEGFAVVQGLCVQCEEGGGGLWAWAGLAGVFVLTAGFLAWLLVRKKDRLEKLAHGSAMVTIKTVLGYAQIVATMSTTLFVTLGPYVERERRRAWQNPHLPFPAQVLRRHHRAAVRGQPRLRVLPPARLHRADGPPRAPAHVHGGDARP
jgi:hypothetical protein